MNYFIVFLFAFCGIVANSLADITKNVPQTVTFKIMNYWGSSTKQGEVIEEKTVSFTSLEELFTKIPTTNLQQALLYLGFCPEEVFYPDDAEGRSFVFNHEWEFSYCYNEIPSDEMILQPPKVIDAKKAFSIIESDIKSQHSAMSKPLLATMYLVGIGCEKNPQKAFELLKDNPTFNMSITDIRNRKYATTNYRFLHRASMFVVAYMYYYGLGVETDKVKSKAIIQSMDRYELWRNFYIGYLAPKNEEFAIFILECSDEFWTALELSKIYAGFYNKNRVDLEKSRFWQAEFEKRKQQHIKNIVVKKLSEDSIVARAFGYGFEKCILTCRYKFAEIELVNPFYNLKNASLYLKEIKEDSFPKHLCAYYDNNMGENNFLKIKFFGKIVEELELIRNR